MKEPQKTIIMLVTNAFTSDPRVNKEARSLVKNGYRVKVIGWDKSRAYPAKEILDGVEVERIHAFPTYDSPSKKILFLPFLWVYIFFKLLFQRFDYIHCHDFDTLPCGICLGKIRRKKVIYDQHEYYGQSIAHNNNIDCKFKFSIARIINNIERYLARRVDRLIVIDHAMAGGYTDISHKVHIVSNFPELAFFNDRPGGEKNRNPHCLLYAGSLIRDRCVIEIIEASANVKEKVGDLELLLVGPVVEAGLGKEMDDMLKAKRYREVVRRVGRVPYEEIPRYMVQAGIGLALFYSEGYHPESPYANNKIFEYLGFGMPVLASGFKTIPDEFAKYNCCLLIDSVSPAAIAEAIMYLIDNPDIALRMGERGKAAVRERFNWDYAEKNLLDVYRALSPGQP